MAMMTSVNRILFRRSATRNMFRRRDSIGGRTSWDDRGAEAASLPVCERVPPGGRPLCPSGRLDRLGRAPGRPDGLGGGGREGVDPDRQGAVDLTPAEDLDQAVLVDEPLGPERLGRDLRPRLEAVEMVEVDDRVLDAEGVLEALELRRPPDEGRLATLELGRDLARPPGALPLRAGTGRLAPAASDTPGDPLLLRVRAGRRLEIVDLGRHLLLLHGDEVRHPGQ